jgi:error-prone DNA polymerase
MACTFVTFRRRSALRDVAKALGLPASAAARVVEALSGSQEMDGEVPDSLEPLLELAGQLVGLPRHLGIHSGGMVITGRPLMGRVPTEPATMPGRVVVQWDKDGLEDAGLVKIDILGLRMLSALSETLAQIDAQPDPHFDDPAVYDLIARAETIGVFQVESRAQAQMLPRLRPQRFHDLVVAISLIRPGPIQGNMVHPYLRRRQGLEPVSYAHPLLETALRDTLGVILFQEQVLLVARDLAGFTPGQGEQLRRALGRKEPGEEIARFEETFLEGARRNGVRPEVAGTVFEQLRAFAGYAFARSHAAAFAVIVYQSAWLKRYHLAAYLVALLNNQPMGFWTPAVLVGEARRRGVTVLPVDIEQSGAVCTVEEGAIRLGFNYVKGLGEEQVGRILAGRPFADLSNFDRHVRPGRLAAERLIMAGAFDHWGIPRRQLLWELGMMGGEGLDLVFEDDPPEFPDLSPGEATLVEQSVLSVSAGDHLLAFSRPWLERQGVVRSDRLKEMENGRTVRVAGLLVVHQSPPTAEGVHFLTIEDEFGLVDVVIHPKLVTQSIKWPFRPAYGLNGPTLLLLVEGIVQRQGNVTNILATRISPLTLPDPGRASLP